MNIFFVNLSKVRNEIFHGQEWDINPYTMGMQISCGIYPEMSQEGIVRNTSKVFRRYVLGFGTARGKQDRGWTFVL